MARNEFKGGGPWAENLGKIILFLHCKKQILVQGAAW